MREVVIVSGASLKSIEIERIVRSAGTASHGVFKEGPLILFYQFNQRFPWSQKGRG